MAITLASGLFTYNRLPRSVSFITLQDEWTANLLVRLDHNIFEPSPTHTTFALGGAT